MPRQRFSQEEELITWVSGQTVRLFRVNGTRRQQSAIDVDFKDTFETTWNETFPQKPCKTRTGVAIRTK